MNKGRTGGYKDMKTVWSRLEGVPVDGIYIGYRTVYDGRREYDDEYGAYFEPTSHQEVWLIVEDPRRKPVFVRPQDCIIVRFERCQVPKTVDDLTIPEAIDNLVDRLNKHIKELGLPDARWAIGVANESMRKEVLSLDEIDLPVRVIDGLEINEVYIVREEDLQV
jgi:hypothetical protein